MKTKEEYPQYEVIRKYPYSPYEIGVILGCYDMNNSGPWYEVVNDPTKERYDGCTIHYNWIVACPDIFKELI